MAFFKFRLPGQSAAPRGGREAAAAVQAESVDALRRRARHRLIGATVLVLAAVIGFPLLFDTQPRPVSVDVPISIPDRQKAKPLTLPATPAAPSATASPAATQAQVGATAGLGPNEEVLSAPRAAATRPVEPKPAPPAPKIDTPPAPKAELKPAAKPEPKAEAQAKPAAQSDEASKARALLEGKDGESTDADRVVVQVGAFSDASKAREARAKLEKAGLKTYTQVVETKDGKRVRVRVGPFANKAEADKAASKIKKLDLPAAILTL
ncbi:SPOR domain-containing protein [Ramlibacter sp. 2FC]|uniref:SPOR domain-containing protein n=1 Tax=Ramlibacter sp. 2FC TaxID=2502188 RepID=UPI0010F73072|nr:SPOR domain-containing protein [Ramlibacter sp. 2FC]